MPPAGRLPLRRPAVGAAKEDNIRLIARTRPLLVLALLAFAMLAAAACIGFNNPEGWAGPEATDGLLVASTDKGKLSVLDLNPEAGPQCDNSTDDDEDGFVNEGCPRVGERAERGQDCDNDRNDDSVDGVPDDDKVNDGCLAWRWTFPTGDEEPEIDLDAIYTTPPVIDGTVYVGAYSGDVYALSLEDGSVLWTFDAGDPIIAGLANSGTVIYAASDGGTLYALDAEDGSEKGSFDAGDSIWAAPLLVEGDLYVASVNGKLFKLDAETLDPVWDEPFETGHGLISDPVLADGTVLVGGIDRVLHAVNAETGEERDGWPFEAGNWFWGRPLVEDGTVYAPNLDGRLHAIDMETGKERAGWPFEAADPDPLRSAPVIAAGVLVIVDRGGTVYGLDPEDGTRQWSSALEKTVLSDPLVLTEEGDEGEDVEKVLISAEGGDLFSVDPATGNFVEMVTP